ncbi:MAG: hypothetical protein P1U68_05340 [Verrucomicrobiales bacterium]|nr:hypothetical protein [Verrucomicrobiales bacterium]
MKGCLLITLATVGGLNLWADEILPTEFPVTRYTALWEDSPFNRQVVATVENRVTNTLGINLSLEGLVTDETAGTIAYMRDLKENKFLVVTKEKSDSVPFYLIDARKSSNPAETRVTISDGKETAEIGFAEGVFTKKIDSPVPVPDAKDKKEATPPPAAPDSAPAPKPPTSGKSPKSKAPAESDSRRRRILLPSRSPATSN